MTTDGIAMADLKIQGEFYSLKPDQVEGECTGCHLCGLTDEHGEYERDKLPVASDGSKTCDGGQIYKLEAL